LSLLRGGRTIKFVLVLILIDGIKAETRLILSDMKSKSIRIEIYYTAGCPNLRITVKRIWEVLKELSIAAEMREVKVDPKFPVPGFLGSPTVHVNDIDIEPSARTSKWMGLIWRTYREGEQIDGAPSGQLIRQAILDGSSLSKTANQ
jgi:hypothetical protein